jgi:hypothetical protein
MTAADRQPELEADRRDRLRREIADAFRRYDASIPQDMADAVAFNVANIGRHLLGMKP